MKGFKINEWILNRRIDSGDSLVYWMHLGCSAFFLSHCLTFSFLWCNSPTWSQAASILRFLDHTQSHTHTHTHTYTHLVGTPLKEWWVRHRSRYLHNTKQTQDNIIFLTGIRTNTPSNQAAANLHRRPHGHRDWSKIELKCIHYIYNKSRTFV